MGDAGPVVRAAGGIVWRRAAVGIEVLLVHRPRYDDWSIPKGKLEAGESDQEAALREVAEETGLDCRIGPEVGSSAYRDRKDRPKTVRYWAMTAEPGGIFTPHDEIDEIRWLPMVEAAALLSYDRDRAVLGTLWQVALPPLLLIRHANAGERRKWKGDDADRPLNARGRSQAEALVHILANHRIERLLTSPARRCRETVQPLARARRLTVEVTPLLAETTPGDEGLALLSSLAGKAVALCTHGDVLEASLASLARRDGVRLPGRIPPPKGSTWVLEADAGRFVAAHFLDAPPKVPLDL